ncbi:MAG: hypothetical protein WC273_08540 [Dehalococcoidia bacterium]
MPGNLDEARRELQTATDRLTRADQRLRDFAVGKRVWGTAERAEHESLRTATNRARRQRDEALAKIIEALGGDDE